MTEPVVTCCVCGVREATQLCDALIGCVDPRHVVTTAFTCDAPLCMECTYQPWHTLHGHDWDHCPEHARGEECWKATYRKPMSDEEASARRSEIHAACKRPPRLSVIRGDR